MKKAYGFPLYEFGLVVSPDKNVYGICIDEDGNFLGSWTSSSLSFLKTDLQGHAPADQYNYSFHTSVNEEVLEAVRKHSLLSALQE